MMIKRILLASGIFASIIYMGSDIIAGLSWPGYNFASQAVSELRGIGAPTRDFLMPILTVYAFLEIAFGVGILKVHDNKRSIRIVGILLISLGILDLTGRFFAMNASESVGSITNTIHIVVTMLTVLFLLMIMIFGSLASGKWFRYYSFFTLFIVLVFSILTFMEVQSIAAGLPTPWMGFKERINIYGYMVWLSVLAIALLKKDKNIGQ